MPSKKASDFGPVPTSTLLDFAIYPLVIPSFSLSFHPTPLVIALEMCSVGLPRGRSRCVPVLFSGKGTVLTTTADSAECDHG